MREKRKNNFTLVMHEEAMKYFSQRDGWAILLEGVYLYEHFTLHTTGLGAIIHSLVKQQILVEIIEYGKDRSDDR